MADMISWDKVKDYAVAGLGGGAVHQITDSLLSQWLSGIGAIAGYSAKDIALILLAQYGSRKTSGMWKTALDGMGVIGVYKVFYPQLVAPIVSGTFGTTSNPNSNSTMNSTLSPYGTG